MRNNILGTIIAAGLLAGSVGGYAYLTSDHAPQAETYATPSTPAQTPSQPAVTPTSQPVTSQSSTAPNYTVPNIDWGTPPPASSYYVAPPSFDNATVAPTPTYHVTAPTQTWHTKPSDNCIGASAVGC